MTFLNIELYEALKAAKVPEDKAKAAATSVHQTDQAALKALLQKEFAKLATKDEVSAAVANLATKDEVSAAVANLATKDEVSSAISKASANLATKDDVSDAISNALANLAAKEALSNAISKLVTKGYISKAFSDAFSKARVQITIWVLAGIFGSMFLMFSLLIMFHNAVHTPPAVAESRPIFGGLPNEIYPIKIRLFPRRQTAAPPAPAANLEQTPNAPE